MQARGLWWTCSSPAAERSPHPDLRGSAPRSPCIQTGHRHLPPLRRQATPTSDKALTIVDNAKCQPPHRLQRRRGLSGPPGHRPRPSCPCCRSSMVERPGRQAGLPPVAAAPGPGGRCRHPPRRHPRRRARTLTQSFWTTSWPWHVVGRRGAGHRPHRPATPPATATAIVTEDAAAARGLFQPPGGLRRRVLERLHPLHRRRGVRPGLRDGHLHPKAPRPGPPGSARSCAASNSSSPATARSADCSPISKRKQPPARSNMTLAGGCYLLSIYCKLYILCKRKNCGKDPITTHSARRSSRSARRSWRRR